ncbi:ABC transporter permease [Herbaspirillum seropedicae]|uniref:ABC-type nitrate/sulfonate/bicarbonate transport system, permease component protein n=1 Tax=Herbaspirillum seropedicae (strain SmR1) TaxID=757424 RepID=D8J285_HERSS|nr:ABC transporter permease [Herbaspirillum seropedicae]ADJ64868.1 ABC-type nitrate/sulfonate/bicarbonate transport system, permease component protein [Herbaspirillum seropedicae SmR1]AKN66770.1 ABC transporter permease [Herbaspirillum seropedicae]AON55660.1 nitrate/sulfonate/bicarbonate ABC transporter permease [Herbaspirillum seropedicae]MDR6395105.1 NitT/TauT family transport system permease protein [Herbaspirillum seropedicae]NQE28235.1 ABC transporter permease [Herbaspirillum seropedicae]
MTQAQASQSAATMDIAAVEAEAQRKIRARKQLVIGLRIAILVIVLGGWEVCARIGWIDPFFFSQPSLIVAQIYDWMVEGTSQGPLWTQVLVTLEETVLGFLIGSVAGVIAGIVLGRNKLLSDVFSLYIQIANSIPRVVLGSIFVIAFGLGMASKVALAVVMVFFVVFANAFQGVREADRYMIANAQILGASRRQVTMAVVIPSALSWILASLHVSFGFALVGAVVGEFLGSKQGIGLLISTAQGAFNASGVFAAMIVLAVVALAADWLLHALERRLLKWRPQAF